MIYADWKHETSPQVGASVVREGHGGDWRLLDGAPPVNEAGVFFGRVHDVRLEDGVVVIELTEGVDEPTPLEGDA